MDGRCGGAVNRKMITSDHMDERVLILIGNVLEMFQE